MFALISLTIDPGVRGRPCAGGNSWSGIRVGQLLSAAVCGGLIKSAWAGHRSAPDAGQPDSRISPVFSGISEDGSHPRVPRLPSPSISPPAVPSTIVCIWISRRSQTLRAGLAPGSTEIVNWGTTGAWQALAICLRKNGPVIRRVRSLLNRVGLGGVGTLLCACTSQPDLVWTRVHTSNQLAIPFAADGIVSSFSFDCFLSFLYVSICSPQKVMRYTMPYIYISSASWLCRFSFSALVNKKILSLSNRPISTNRACT